MRIPRGPLKGTIILLAIAGLLTLGLLAIQGRLTPKRPAANTIAFISDRSGHVDLWTMNVDGSSPETITNDVSPEAFPSWSRDRTRLVFTAERSGVTQVFTADAIGGRRPQQLTVGTGVKLQPIFSPDAEHIAYIAQGRVYVMYSDGSDIEPVLPSAEGEVIPEAAAGLSKHPYTEVDWSADGKSLAAVQQVEEIQIPQLQDDLSKKAKIITGAQGQSLNGEKVFIKWGPTGRKLAVSTVVRNKGALVVRDYDENTDAVVVADAAPGRLAWSPSGEQIAFELQHYTEGRGYSVTGLAVADVGAAVHQTIATGEISGPSWSSDGKLVIFTKTEKDGARNVWSVKPDGSDARNLTSGHGNNYDAAASPARAE